MADKVTADNFASELIKQMTEYSKACSEEVKDVIKEAAKKARTELKRTSPKRSDRAAVIMQKNGV